MLSDLAEKSSIKKVLKWVFSGFSIFFISMLIFLLVHDVMTGEHLLKHQLNIVQNMDF